MCVSEINVNTVCGRILRGMPENASDIKCGKRPGVQDCRVVLSAPLSPRHPKGRLGFRRMEFFSLPFRKLVSKSKFKIPILLKLIFNV